MQLQPIFWYTVRLKSDYMITTPIFYVNSAPHIGHLYSALLADAHARFRCFYWLYCMYWGYAIIIELFLGDVVLDNFNMAYMDEDRILDQIFSDFYYEDLKF